MPTMVEAPVRLADGQREGLQRELERDGYAVLPERLPTGQCEELIAAMDRIARERRAADPALTGVKVQNCVDLHPAFRRLMLYEPALQMCHDVFGPMFHLNQSNFVSRPRDHKTVADFLSSSPWHADGPRPAQFPAVGGAMGLHYLKFGYFLTDLTHGNGGSLQVVRGSHRRPELDGRNGAFRVEDYGADIVSFDCPAGTVVAFHQALWHAAPPNESATERKNLYISYCPTWMRPIDREFPAEADLAGLTPEERWLLGEPRPAMRWWLPTPEDLARMSRFRRDGDTPVSEVKHYD